MERPGMAGIDQRKFLLFCSPKQVGGSTCTVRMHQINIFSFYNVFNPLPNPEIKWLLCIYNVCFDTQAAQAIYHWPVGKRNHYRFKPAAVQVFNQRKQVTFAATNFSLPD